MKKIISFLLSHYMRLVILCVLMFPIILTIDDYLNLDSDILFYVAMFFFIVPALSFLYGIFLLIKNSIK